MANSLGLTWDGEEDDHDRDNSGCNSPSDQVLGGFDAQISPHDLLRCDTKLGGMKLLVGLSRPLQHHLPSILCKPLGLELNENSSDKFALSVPVLVLLLRDLGDDLSQVRASVLNGIDLLANQEFELVSWTLLWVNPFGTVSYIGGDEVLLALLGFHTVLVGVRR
jgi:hypothetical protein